jgi:hydrogenase maturation protease
MMRDMEAKSRVDQLARWNVVVAGFGSPHGDDQAGWQVVALLERQGELPARRVKIAEGTQLVEELARCRRLIVVDACRSGAPLGTITRLEWPDRRIRRYHNHSTHGVALCNALQLAERLGRLPPSVEILGIEIGSLRPLEEISAEVARAVAQVAEIISSEVYETAHA